jgi:hypothetical protein
MVVEKRLVVDQLIRFWSDGPKSVDEESRGLCKEVAAFLARSLSGVELLALQESPEERRAELEALVGGWLAARSQEGGGAARGGIVVSAPIHQTNAGGVNVGVAGAIHGGINLGAPAALAARSEDRSPPAPPPSAAGAALRILFLAANPADSSRLRLDEEVRAIDRALTAASLGSRCELVQKWAVRVGDIQEHLLKVKPHVLHFSGHGGPDGSIAFHGEGGKTRPVDVDRLARLLARFNERLRCVVLNACYSKEHAESIAREIDCVVGMSTAVGDRASIRFASCFYLALASACSVEDAFEQARADVELGERGQDAVPTLLAKRCAPTGVFLVKER